MGSPSTSQLRAINEVAQNEARQRNQLVEPSHLLLAILRAPDCGAHRLIKPKVESMAALAARALAAVDAAPVQRDVVPNRIPLSKTAKAAIERSAESVMSPPIREWNSCDVLLGIVRDGTSPAAEILTSVGITNEWIDCQIESKGLSYFFDNSEAVTTEDHDG